MPKKGQTASPETRAKLSAALKNHVRTPEHSAAISVAKKGIPRGSFSEAHKQKISVALKNHVRTPEHSAAISRALMGKPSHKQSATERQKRSRTIVKRITEGNFKKLGTVQTRFGLLSYRNKSELLCYKRLVSDPTVVTLEVENTIIPYTQNGVKRLYIPDVTVKRTNGSFEIIEIKKDPGRSGIKDRTKWSAARKWCRRQPHPTTFSVITP